MTLQVSRRLLEDAAGYYYLGRKDKAFKLLQTIQDGRKGLKLPRGFRKLRSKLERQLRRTLQ